MAPLGTVFEISCGIDAPPRPNRKRVEEETRNHRIADMSSSVSLGAGDIGKEPV